jgi:hypothetical protein
MPAVSRTAIEKTLQRDRERNQNTYAHPSGQSVPQGKGVNSHRKRSRSRRPVTPPPVSSPPNCRDSLTLRKRADPNSYLPPPEEKFPPPAIVHPHKTQPVLGPTYQPAPCNLTLRRGLASRSPHKGATKPSPSPEYAPGMRLPAPYHVRFQKSPTVAAAPNKTTAQRTGRCITRNTSIDPNKFISQSPPSRKEQATGADSLAKQCASPPKLTRPRTPPGGRVGFWPGRSPGPAAAKQPLHSRLVAAFAHAPQAPLVEQEDIGTPRSARGLSPADRNALVSMSPSLKAVLERSANDVAALPSQGSIPCNLHDGQLSGDISNTSKQALLQPFPSAASGPRELRRQEILKCRLSLGHTPDAASTHKETHGTSRHLAQTLGQEGPPKVPERLLQRHPSEPPPIISSRSATLEPKFRAVGADEHRGVHDLRQDSLAASNILGQDRPSMSTEESANSAASHTARAPPMPMQQQPAQQSIPCNDQSSARTTQALHQSAPMDTCQPRAPPAPKLAPSGAHASTLQSCQRSHACSDIRLSELRVQESRTLAKTSSRLQDCKEEDDSSDRALPPTVATLEEGKDMLTRVMHSSDESAVQLPSTKGSSEQERLPTASTQMSDKLVGHVFQGEKSSERVPTASTFASRTSVVVSRAAAIRDKQRIARGEICRRPDLYYALDTSELPQREERGPDESHYFVVDTRGLDSASTLAGGVAATDSLAMRSISVAMPESSLAISRGADGMESAVSMRRKACTEVVAPLKHAVCGIKEGIEEEDNSCQSARQACKKPPAAMIATPTAGNSTTHSEWEDAEDSSQLPLLRGGSCQESATATARMSRMLIASKKLSPRLSSEIVCVPFKPESMPYEDCYRANASSETMDNARGYVSAAAYDHDMNSMPVDQELSELQSEADAVLAAMMNKEPGALMACTEQAPQEDAKSEKLRGLSGYKVPSRTASTATNAPLLRHVSIFSHASRNVDEVLADTARKFKVSKASSPLQTADRTERLLKPAKTSLQCPISAVVPEDVALVLELQCASTSPCFVHQAHL